MIAIQIKPNSLITLFASNSSLWTSSIHRQPARKPQNVYHSHQPQQQSEYYTYLWTFRVFEAFFGPYWLMDQSLLTRAILVLTKQPKIKYRKKHKRRANENPLLISLCYKHIEYLKYVFLLLFLFFVFNKFSILTDCEWAKWDRHNNCYYHKAKCLSCE